MSVPLTGTGGLFTRIGKILGGLNEVNNFRGSTTVGPRIDTIEAQFQSTDQNLVDALYTARDNYRGSHSLPTDLQTLATNTVIQMVDDDTYLSSKDIAVALLLLIRQMKAAAASVNASVPAITATADSGNAGNGVVIASKVGPDGKDLQYVLPETLLLTVTDDSQQGSATAAQEPAIMSGELAQSDPLQWNWPLGSAASTTLTFVDANSDNGTNVLTNSDFERFTVANTPDNFTIVTGTPGTTILSGGSGNAYTNSNCLDIKGNGAELTKLKQQFNNSGGTLGKLTPLTVYAINFFQKVDVVPAAGVLKVSLVDGSGTVINDANGVANSISITLSGTTTSYVAKNTFFRTPATLPTNYYLQIELTTALDNNKHCYVDRLALTPAVATYTGGCFVGAFSASINVSKNDFWTLAVTDTFGGFQKGFERLFGMKALGLTLPFSGSPTISDSLIA